MLHTIIIRTLPGHAGGHIKFDSIKMGQDNFMITKDFRVIQRSKVLPSDEPMYLRLTPQNAFSFKYDDSDIANEYDVYRKKMAELIPYYHQMQNVDGMKYKNEFGRMVDTNPNSVGGAIYEFEDLAATGTKNYDLLNIKINALNKARNMSFREKVDTMHYYGENPVGLTHKDVFMRLCDEHGLVTRRLPHEGSKKTVMEHFVQDYKQSDPVYVLKTAIIKAMNLRTSNGSPLITKSGNAINLDGSIIGNTIEEAIVWLNTNDEKRKHLLRTVSEIDTLGLDDLDATLESLEDGGTGEVIQHIDEDKIKAKAKALLVPRYWQIGIKELIEGINHSEKVFKKVEELGLQPELDQMKAKTLEKIEALVNKKLQSLEMAS